MSKTLAVLKFWVALLASMILVSLPAAAQDDPLPVIEWQKRLTADERLTAFGSDLMGDAIDTHLGSISFSHTDVSLPGNSNLDVSICLLYTSPSPRDLSTSRMPSSA